MTPTRRRKAGAPPSAGPSPPMPRRRGQIEFELSAHGGSGAPGRRRRRRRRGPSTLAPPLLRAVARISSRDLPQTLLADETSGTLLGFVDQLGGVLPRLLEQLFAETDDGACLATAPLAHVSNLAQELRELVKVDENVLGERNLGAVDDSIFEDIQELDDVPLGPRPKLVVGSAVTLCRGAVRFRGFDGRRMTFTAYSLPS